MIYILAVTKNEQLKRDIATAMTGLGYTTVFAALADDALDQLSLRKIALVVAEDEAQGLELCEDLRDAGNSVPVIIVTADENRAQRRAIFRCGADGFLSLPVDREELQMHVKNLLWRCHVEDDAVMPFGDCRLCAGTLTVEADGQVVELRRMEFLLLEKLISYPGRIFTRTQLMDDLWGYDSESSPRTVDTHIKRLRTKLKAIDKIKIQTVRGIGYRVAPIKKSAK